MRLAPDPAALRSAARRSLHATTALMVAPWALLAAGEAGDQPSPQRTAQATSIARAFADADGDFRPDRLGDTVTVAGRATVATGVLESERLSVFIADTSGAVQLFGPEIGEPVARGDRVVATGVVSQYKGQAQLEVHTYRVASSSASVPAPVRLTSPDSTQLEAHEGRLVRLSGLVVGAGSNAGGDYLWIHPEDARNAVQVFVGHWREPPVELDSFDYGDRIDATGIVGQYDEEAPFTSRYQIHPRTSADLEQPPLALGLTAGQAAALGGGLAALLIGGLGWWGLRTRRERDRLADRYRILFDRNQAGVFRTTVEGSIVDCNPALADIYGFDSPEEMIDARAWDLYPDLSEREAYIRALRADGEVEDYLQHQHTRDGDDVWVLENARLVEREGREEIVGTAVDLTDRILAEREQEAAEERYRALFERNVAGAFRSRLDGTLVEVNDAFARMLGYETPEELEGEPARQLYDEPERHEELRQRLREEGVLNNAEIVLRTREGDRIWVLENSFLVEDPDSGDPVNIGTVTEITERVREEKKLEELAHRDPLTGLPNRRFLENAVPRLLAQADREEDHVGIVYLDLNGFKEVNDRWGHGTGDEVIRAVARRLAETARESDLVARVGGDEFVLVLPGQDGRQDARRATRRQAEQAFQKPVEAGGEVFPMSASFGVAVFPEDGTEFQDLLTRADRAMYRASRSGKTLELYDENVDRPYDGRLLRSQRISDALDDGDVLGYTQPIYRIGDGRLAGVEMLARWRRPDGSLVGAAELIPGAREAGLLPELDRLMLRLGARHASEREEISVSVNLSKEFLQSEDAADYVRSVLREYPAAGDRLTVEVTEHTAMADPAETRDTLNGIAEIGLRLALDDFGTGFSSLSLLEKLPVGVVKIDRSIVSEIGRGERAEPLLSGVIDLSHSLGASVIAEGVERRDQLSWLAENGCDEVQGYLMGRPSPPDDEPPVELSQAVREAEEVTSG